MYRNYVLGTRNTLTVKKKVFISELLIEEFNNESENQKVNPMSRKQVFVNLFKIYKRADKLPNLIYFPQFVYDEVQLLFGHDLIEEKFKSLSAGTIKSKIDNYKLQIFEKFMGIGNFMFSSDLVKV
jgi:hypothetical protein